MPGQVTFPLVFGPHRTGLWFALCLAQAYSWATLVHDRSKFVYLLLNQLIFLENLVLIFRPLTWCCAFSRNLPCFAQKSHIKLSESYSLTVLNSSSRFVSQFPRPNSSGLFSHQNPRKCTISHVNEELRQQLKPNDWTLSAGHDSKIQICVDKRLGKNVLIFVEGITHTPSFKGFKILFFKGRHMLLQNESHYLLYIITSLLGFYFGNLFLYQYALLPYYYKSLQLLLLHDYTYTMLHALTWPRRDAGCEVEKSSSQESTISAEKAACAWSSQYTPCIL